LSRCIAYSWRKQTEFLLDSDLVEKVTAGHKDFNGKVHKLKEVGHCFLGKKWSAVVTEH